MLKEKNKILEKLLLIKKELEKFLRIFIFLLLMTMIIINWGLIKDMFNYKAVHADLLNNLKTKFNKEKEIVLKVPQVRLGESELEISDRENSLEIPKIEVTAPLVFSESAREKDLLRLLKKGVVFYPDSTLPGEEGITVILGHSAPSNWPKINYDWIFTRLNELNPGDEILIYFNHRKYPYKVTNKFFLKKGDEIPKPDLSESKSFLTLLSCWPPGINNKRIAIQAELQF